MFSGQILIYNMRKLYCFSELNQGTNYAGYILEYIRNMNILPTYLHLLLSHGCCAGPLQKAAGASATMPASHLSEILVSLSQWYFALKHET